MNPDEDRGVFGQRTFKKITGRREDFGFESESPLEREDRIFRESNPEDVEGQQVFGASEGTPETLSRRMKGTATDHLSETMGSFEHADREYVDRVRVGGIIELSGLILDKDSRAK